MTTSPMCRLVTRMVCPSRTPVRRPSRGSSVLRQHCRLGLARLGGGRRRPRLAPRVADPREALDPVTRRLVQVAEDVADTLRIHDPAPVEDLDDGLARGRELIVLAADDLDVGDGQPETVQLAGEPAVRLGERAGGLLGEVADDERILLAPRVQDGNVRDVAREMRPEAVGTWRDIEPGGQRDHAGETIGEVQTGVPGREPTPRIPERIHAVRIDVHATRDGVDDEGVLGHEWRLGGDVVLPVLGRGDDELAGPRAQHAPDLFGPRVGGLARRVQGVDERPCPIAPVAVGEDERDLARCARLRLHGHRRGPRSHLLEGHAAVQPVAQPRGPVVGVQRDASGERCPCGIAWLSPVRADKRGGVVLGRGRARRARRQPEQGCERHHEGGEREGPGRHGVRPLLSRAAGQTASLPPCRLA